MDNKQDPRTIYAKELAFAKEFMQVMEQMHNADDSIIPKDVQVGMMLEHLDAYMELHEVEVMALIMGLLKVIDIATVEHDTNELIYGAIDIVIDGLKHEGEYYDDSE